jgi:hypothetical protein
MHLYTRIDSDPLLEGMILLHWMQQRHHERPVGHARTIIIGSDG